MQRTEVKNPFEFVAVASARAHQLLKGCSPKVEAESQKKARVAMKEVRAGAIGKDESSKK